VTTVLVAHLRGTSTVAAGERSEEAAAPVEPPPDPAPQPVDPPPEVERLERELEELREELLRARSEAGESQRLREELETTRAQLAERLASVEGELGAVRERIEDPPPPAAAPPGPEAVAETESVPADPVEASKPVEEPLAERRARGVGRILAALEGGRAGEALGQLEALRAQGVFPATDPAGSDLLLALARGGLALDAADVDALGEGGRPDLERLDEAEGHLRRARRLRDTFEEEAAPWLASGGPPPPAPARLARLDGCLTDLEGRQGAARAEIERLHEEDWQWILGLGVPQDPALVDRHVEGFGCDHDEVLLAATVDAWLAHCVWSGEVAPLELAAAQHLRAWGARASAEPPQQRSAREVELLWLWNALRWYVDGADPASFDWRGLDVPEVLAPRDDWRAELRLAVELALPGAGWPPSEGRLAIYHVDAPGPARWRVDEVERVEGAGARWHLVRRHFAADGVPLGGGVNVVVERSGQSFSYAGADTALVDLRASGAQVSVAPCPVAAPHELPAMEGVDLFEVEGVVPGTGRASGTCLVQRDGEWTRWLLPGLGLVREEREGPDGRVRIELCAVGSAP
jgi:hypothetical protein